MNLSRRRFLGAGLGAGAVAATLPQLSRDQAETTEGARETRALVAGSLLSVADVVPDAAVEAHGSLAVRQLIVEGAREPDAVALADPSLFEGIADRPTLFATNALVVAVDPDSARAAAIRDDWAAALAREEVRVGRTDPQIDPLGYRTILALKLAERTGLADRREILDGSTVLPETELARALGSGKLDAAFTYRNMAVERGLPFVDLPDGVDFSDPARAETYGSVSLQLSDRTVRGTPIRYAAAATTEQGESWVRRLVDGAERLREHGFDVPDDYPKPMQVEE